MTDKKTITIGADLPPNQTSEKELRAYMDAGFNLLAMTEDHVKTTSPEYLKCLELCEKLDLDVHMRQYSNQAPYYFENNFKGVDFKKYPAVKGFYIDDESPIEILKKIEEVNVPWFNKEYEGYDWFLNFFSYGRFSYFEGSTTEGWTYEEFLKYYLDNVAGKVKARRNIFSVDRYPLRKKKGVYYLADENWLKGLCYVSNQVHQKGMDFGAYIQCFNGYYDTRLPESPNDLLFQMYLYLAFGAIQLTYFVYRGVTRPDYAFEGVTGENGELTPVYDMAKEANKQILFFGSEYVKYKWKGIMFVNGQNDNSAKVEFDKAREICNYSCESISEVICDRDTLIGCFEDEKGNEAYIVITYAEPSENLNNNVTIVFDTTADVSEFKKCVRRDFVGKRYQVCLERGEGVFLKR